VSYEGDAAFEQVQTGLVFPATSPLAQDLPADGNQDGNPDPTPADLLLAGQFDEGGVLDRYQQQASADGTLSTQTIETEITFPFQLVAGVSVQASEKLLLLADYQLTGWSAFDEIPLQFSQLGDRAREENYDNTHAVRLGAEYDVLDQLTARVGHAVRLGAEYDVLDQLTARVGYLHNTAAAPDEVVTPLLPESNRNQLTVGFGWRPIERAELTVSYQLLQQNDRRGRVRSPRAGESLSTDLNQGVYSFGANLFGTTLTLYL
jgi:long-chain fatty acid transport protein